MALEFTANTSSLILSQVEDAARRAPCAELKQAAGKALIIFETIQDVKENKEAYKGLGDDSSRLIADIWCSYKTPEFQKEPLSVDMKGIFVELTCILEDVRLFVQEQLARSKAMRLMHSRTARGKIAEHRKNLNAASQKFELHRAEIRYWNNENIKGALKTTAREARDQEKAEGSHEGLEVLDSPLEELKQIDINDQAEDEQVILQGLKKRERDRKLELERLRAEVIRQEDEKEMAELKLRIAAVRRNTLPQAQSSKKKSRRQKDEVEEEGEGESEEIERSVKPSSRAKNLHKSPSQRSHIVSDNSAYDDSEEECFQPQKMRKAYVEEPEEQLAGEEESPPPKKNPKINRGPQSPPSQMNDMTTRFQGFSMPSMDNLHGTRSNSVPIFHSPYHGSPLSPSMEPFGIGGPGSVFNSGDRNSTTMTISNVGNNNSVREVHHAAPRKRTRVYRV